MSSGLGVLNGCVNTGYDGMVGLNGCHTKTDFLQRLSYVHLSCVFHPIQCGADHLSYIIHMIPIFG